MNRRVEDVPRLERDGTLSPNMQRRAAALQEARAVLASRPGIHPPIMPDIYDLVTVSTWILTGKDPWADNKQYDGVDLPADGPPRPIRVVPNEREDT